MSSTTESSKISAKGMSHLDKLKAAETPTKSFCLPFMVGFEIEANLKIGQARDGKCHIRKVRRAQGGGRTIYGVRVQVLGITT